MKLIVNCETGETTERALNKKELEQQAKDEAVIAEYEAKKAADAEAKAALLARLGITESEAQLLLGGSN